MNTSVQIIKDIFNASKSYVAEGEDVISILRREFETFPESARLFNGYVSIETDVTPNSNEEVERLAKIPGNYIVVIFPAGALSLVWYIVAAVVAAVVVMTVLKPKIPNISARNVQSESANNSLANRSNESRPKARIPDIFGTVRAYPDLVQVPYSFWVDNIQRESTIMVLGRGEYQIHDVKESDTEVSQVPGTAISLWNPNKDIEVDAPDATYGPDTHGTDEIWDRWGVAIVKRSNSVDGQTLEAGNQASNNGVFTFNRDGGINANGFLNPVDFTKLFNVGDNLRVDVKDPGISRFNSFLKLNNLFGTPHLELQLENNQSITPIVAGDQLEFTPTTWEVLGSGGTPVGTYDFSGRYTVDYVITIPDSATVQIYLVNPAAVNANWAQLAPSPRQTNFKFSEIAYGVFSNDYSYLRGTFPIVEVGKLRVKVTAPGWSALPADPSVPLEGTLSSSSTVNDGGPFTVAGKGVRGFALNFFAQQGMYKDDGENQIAHSVIVEAKIMCYDEDDVLIAALMENVTIQGNAIDRKSKGSTLYITVPPSTRFVVSASRLTPKDTEFKGQVVDEVKWRDLYAISPVDKSNFGNVTMLRVTSRATDAALAAKSRKLNMKVTRKISIRDVDGNFTTTLYPTNYIADIFHHICTDPYIGNRPAYEVDVPQIYNQCVTASQYFGFMEMVEFCYTFDNTGISFEETAQLVAGAGLLTAYRQGQLIKLEFERKGAPSKLMFNHRNKIPGSEKRTFHFKRENNYDGLQYTWVNPEDDSVQTLYLPNDLSINPRKVESIGVRNENQAHVQAWREWNKIQFRNTTLEFEGLSESETVIPPNCILVADNTNSVTADGYIVSQTALTLELSQDVEYDPLKTYSIVLQMSDGSIEIVGVTFTDSRTVQLANPTLRPIVTDLDNVAQTTYEIVASDDKGQRKFIITDRGGGDATSNSYPITAINYDDRYYSNDQDFAPDGEEEWLKSLGNLILWLDAADSSTIIESTGITQWIDKSDALNDAKQPAVQLRPSVATNIFVPAGIKFDNVTGE